MNLMALCITAIALNIPKLVVTDVPEGEEVTRDLLARAGYLYPLGEPRVE
jgi:hypothetical protein